ncbi:flagellar filament capping protein FliD [Legionella genomosp. 1]|uniref:flagellar filament capping protein FliD n=1 Tax=Legionella genomosp. 1 TaxID=1093625 RepID=UPI00105564FC|nr:flagellar filament capping protein FliD [Legionella genomosp. 1]
MSGISSPGVGSGLDIKSIVEALVKAEITPAKNRIDRHEADLVAELSALGQVKSALSKLQSSLIKLGDLKQFHSLKTTLSDPNALQATIGDYAIDGHYDIEITQLAAKQNLASGAFANASSPVGQGSLTIEFGSYSNDLSSFTLNADKDPLVITIGAGQSSLVAIRDAINNSDSGVQAAIVQDSQGARLTLSSPSTGKSYEMRITVNDVDGNNTNGAGLSALAYDPTNGVNSMLQTAEAKDSQFKINGLLLTESSNRIENAIAGVTLDLKKAQPGTLISLGVEANRAQTTSLIREFVKQFNDSMNSLNNLTSYDPNTKKAGSLQGDTGIRNLKFSLSALVSDVNQDTSSPLKTLADLGIKTTKSGLLEINEDQLTKALDTHYESIGAFFAKSAKASDSNVKISLVGADVKAGTYALTIDSFNPGVSLSGTIGGLIATSSNGLTLKGSGAYKNLSVDITGGGIGARGNITVTNGLAVKFNDLIEQLLDDKGSLVDRTSSLNNQIERIAEDRVQLDYRTQELGKRYLKQFTALDGLLSQMQSTSNFLSQQLANLPQLTLNKR